MLTTPKFKEWIPPQKIFYYQTLNTGFQPHNLGIWRLKDAFCQQGFVGIEFTESLETTIASVASCLRQCDVVVVYTSGIGSSTLVPSSAELDGTEERIVSGGVTCTDDRIREAVIKQKWNGANVTLVFDTLTTDLADAPCNATVSTSVNTLQKGVVDESSWPIEVKVLYSTSVSFSSRTLPEGLLRAGSFSFQSSWFALGLLRVLVNRRWEKVTYKQLLIELQQFYSTLSRDVILRRTAKALEHKDCTGPQIPVPTLDYGSIPMWNVDLMTVNAVRQLQPMVGMKNLKSFDDVAFAKQTQWSPTRQQGPIKKAVLVGVTYKTDGSIRNINIDVNGVVFGAPSLESPPNDTLLMYKILTERMGFHPDNIVMLQGSVPKARVVQALEWLMADNLPDNQLVFYYSGHGSTVLDTSGDEVDNNDELIVLQESPTQASTLTDDELYATLISKNAANCPLTCFFDCCHSGSMCDTDFLTYADFGRSDIPTISTMKEASRRTKSVGNKRTHVYSATSDNTSTFEFYPLHVGAQLPVAPNNFSWTSEDPSFGCMTFSLWSAMEKRGWKAVTNAQLLQEMRSFYLNNSIPSQAICTPTYGYFQAGGDLSYFFQ
jgi:hypothetical protein